MSNKQDVIHEVKNHIFFSPYACNQVLASMEVKGVMVK